MRLSITVLFLLALFLLASVLPIPGGLSAQAVYYSPVFILLLFLLCGCCVWCCRRRKFGLKQTGFYLVHLGVVVILAGAFAGYLLSVKGVLKLSVKPSVAVDRLTVSKHDPVPFGFSVAAENFQVKFYPPVYQLYRRLPPEKIVPGQMPYKQIGEFSATDRGICMVDESGPVSNLWNETSQEWVQRKMLADGSFLNLAGQTPSFYGVTLKIDGQQLPVSINHPADWKGWRFYLMSYDPHSQSYVQFSVRRDPGRKAVVAGIWLTIAGMFIFCFRKEGGAV